MLTWYPCAATRLPPRGLRGQRRAHGVPVEDGLVGQRRPHRRQTGLMAEQLPHRDPGLVLRSELGPDPGHRIVKGERALPDQAGHAQGGHRLPDGEDIDQGVLLPWPVAVAVLPATPQVHHRPSRPPRCTPRPRLRPGSRSSRRRRRGPRQTPDARCRRREQPVGGPRAEIRALPGVPQPMQGISVPLAVGGWKHQLGPLAPANGDRAVADRLLGPVPILRPG